MKYIPQICSCIPVWKNQQRTSPVHPQIYPNKSQELKCRLFTKMAVQSFVTSYWRRDQTLLKRTQSCVWGLHRGCMITIAADRYMDSWTVDEHYLNIGDQFRKTLPLFLPRSLEMMMRILKMRILFLLLGIILVFLTAVNGTRNGEFIISFRFPFTLLHPSPLNIYCNVS